MAISTYYIDRKVQCLGPNGPVEEPLVPELVERGNVVEGKEYSNHPLAHPEAKRVDVTIFVYVSENMDQWY
jgi:hypothetical protein